VATNALGNDCFSTLTSYNFASQLQDLEEIIIDPDDPMVQIPCGAN
jgi:hypothetical protein